MYFNKFFSIFLLILYFDLVSCFYKSIKFNSNILCVNKNIYLYNSILPDILLPYLTPEDKSDLEIGKIIQKQERNGNRGAGFVILDIHIPPDIVFDTLTRFDTYQDMIPLVRSSKIVASDGINTMVKFILSRFLLHIIVKHRVLRDKRLINFTLDTTHANPIFREAEGFWYVEIPTDRPEGYCRVYLSVKILADKMVPTLILDYIASSALPSATKWLKPFFVQKNFIINNKEIQNN